MRTIIIALRTHYILSTNYIVKITILLKFYSENYILIINITNYYK